MAVSIRVSDTLAVIVITTVTFSCVWGLLVNQDVKGKEQGPLKEETDSQTFSPSSPVLSQMDYEILGTSGFSITNVMQNSNFSEVSKLNKADLPHKEQSEVSKVFHGNIPVTIQHFLSSATMKQESTTSGMPPYTTANRQEITTTDQPKEELNPSGMNDASIVAVSTLQPFQGFLFTERSEGDVKATIALKSLVFRTTASLTSDQSFPSTDRTPGHESSVLKNSVFESTTNAGSHNYSTPSLNLNKVKNLTEEEGIISNLTDSAVYMAFANNSSSETKQNDAPKEQSIKHAISSNELEGNATDINVTTFSDSTSTDSSLQHSKREDIATKNEMHAYKVFTIQPYSPIKPYTDSLHTWSNAPSENNTWTTPSISIPKEESIETTSTDTTLVSTELSHSQFSSVDEKPGLSVSQDSGVSTEEETESTFSSSSATESEHVTSGTLPTLVTTDDIQSTHVSPLFTERPQVLVNISGQIRIIRGMIWMYQLNDKMSAEFQYYSRKVQRMLEEMFWQTWLAKHIKKIDVHRFRRGSVMVDFRLVVKTERHIQPQEMELLFNSFLLPDGGFGGFQMDRHFTKFQIYEPVVTVESPISLENNNLPQWATALIVISGASLIFVVLFGVVTVYGTFPFFTGKSHQRLKEEVVSSKNCKQPKVDCTEWERKAAAAYENLSADGIYDLDEVGENKLKVVDGHRRKLENTEVWSKILVSTEEGVK